MHWAGNGRNLLLCEFESEEHMHAPSLNDDLPGEPVNILKTSRAPPDPAQASDGSLDCLHSPLEQRRREGAGLVTVISHMQARLSAAKTVEELSDTVVALVQDLTKFHRVMVYRFDQEFNGAVIAEIVYPQATGDIYKGLRFPASDIPAQARKLYQINRVRLLFDRDQPTSRLVCRTVEDLHPPLDLTHSYLRAMSPIHLKYLANMGVLSTMSISLELQGKLWGLICCHSYGPTATNVSFQMREVCHWIGLCASDCLEKISYRLQLQSRQVLEALHTTQDPESCITASVTDILKLFDARSGFMVVNGEAKSIGRHDAYQEAILLLRYVNTRQFSAVTACSNISVDYPDLFQQGNFIVVAGFLAIPLSANCKDFLLLLRANQIREVAWAGRPQKMANLASSSSKLEPRESFNKWTEKINGFSKEWTDEQCQDFTSMIRLVYGNFIDVWRQRERYVARSRMKQTLLLNASHDGKQSPSRSH
jgi:light-regulated signal transduction histidine kinase (bacteriophytochrome)